MTWKFRPFCMLAVLAFVSACSFLGEKTDYKIEGVAPDTDVAAYLDDVLDDNLQEPIDTNDPEERARKEEYREIQINESLRQAMQAKGYYDAQVNYKDSADPNAGTFTIDPGDLYTIERIDIQPAAFADHMQGIELKKGQVLDAAEVLAAMAQLQRHIQKDQCYFSLEVTHEVRLNKTRKTGAISFHVAAGPQATFGTLSFSGLQSVKESYVQLLVPWREGECFRHDKIESLRTELLNGGLFSRADIIISKAPQKDGTVPLTLDVKERAHRSLKAGLNYYTDEGFGTLLGWEHRNLFGAAEKLTANLIISQIKQVLEFALIKPHFQRKDQNLNFTTTIGREDTDAFKKDGIDAGVSISRAFTKRLSGSTGVDVSFSTIEDISQKTEDTYGLISLPQTLSYDSRDNALDPHKGWLFGVSVEPFFDLLGVSDPFFKTRATASTYLSLKDDSPVVLALRGSVGSIIGADLENIPATERFYAGGGGSVRGFGYQDIGPSNNDREPTGGLSVVESTAELRFKITNDFGAVTFVDAGSVSENTNPEFSDLAVGAGVGVRYYTGFGPIRFDIATPLTNKDESDKSYQFYISLGQAF